MYAYYSITVLPIKFVHNLQVRLGHVKLGSFKEAAKGVSNEAFLTIYKAYFGKFSSREISSS
jgi:hypothetical protein